MKPNQKRDRQRGPGNRDDGNSILRINNVRMTTSSLLLYLSRLILSVHMRLRRRPRGSPRRMAKRRPGRRPRWRPRWTSLPGLGVGHGRARPPLRPVDERGPFPLAPQDRRALLPPGRHLQLHGGEDVPGGLHPLDLDAGDGHAPRGRDRVQVLEEGSRDEKDSSRVSFPTSSRSCVRHRLSIASRTSWTLYLAATVSWIRR